MILLALLIASPADYLPCTEGLTIEYGKKVRDTVRGQDRKGLCKIERVTRIEGKETRDAYLREILADRVLAAGWDGAAVAFRPPLLVAPVKVGTKWRFNRSDYRITKLEKCRVAQKEYRCVTVERTAKGQTPQVSVYAEGVGLVRQSQGDTDLEATAVYRHKGARTRKSRERTRP